MRGDKGRWLAPSATPWDDADEGSLGPAETLVMACHRDIYRYRHAGASLEGEGNGKDANGIRRWRCRSCGRSFNVTTGTIFESHRIPVADWTEFLIETFSYESLKGMARSNRRSKTTPPYWLAKLFAVLSGIQDGVVLSGNTHLACPYNAISA